MVRVGTFNERTPCQTPLKPTVVWRLKAGCFCVRLFLYLLRGDVKLAADWKTKALTASRCQVSIAQAPQPLEKSMQNICRNIAFLCLLSLASPAAGAPDEACMSVCQKDGNAREKCESGCDEKRYIKTGLPARPGREPSIDPICVKDCMAKPDYGRYPICVDMCFY